MSGWDLLADSFTPTSRSMMIISLILLTAFVLAPVTAFLAGQRGYDMSSWYLAGLFLGPLGLLAWLLPKRNHEPEALFGLGGQ